MRPSPSARRCWAGCPFPGPRRKSPTARDGQNVDAAFRRGAALALEIARREGAALAVLQPRSPSCGVKEIYDGTFSGKRIPGMGVFARLLAEAGIRALEPEDLTGMPVPAGEK